jgi:hypothetical protein
MARLIFQQREQTMPDPTKRSFPVAIVISALALVLTGLSFYYTKTQNDYTRERAAGRLPARLELVGSKPDANTLKPALRKSIFGSEYTTMFFGTPTDVVNLNECVILRNVGDEPIEAIRVTVSYAGGFNEKDVFKVVGLDQPPIVTEQQVHKEDHILDQKMTKGEVALIPLTKGMLHQMLQAQKDRAKDVERFGVFRVRSSAKIVGASSFDGIYDDKELTLRLLWLPSGFDEEQCTKLIERFQPRVEIMKDGTKPAK